MSGTALLVVVVALAGSTLGKFVCPGKNADPCASTKPGWNWTCCATHPCPGTYPPGTKYIDIALAAQWDTTTGEIFLYQHAVDLVNSDPTWFPGEIVRLHPVNTHYTHAGAINSFGCDLLNDDGSVLSPPKIQVLIGDVYSLECAEVGIVANVLDIPMLSGTAGSDALSDKTLYRTFSRTVAPTVYQSRAIAQLMEYFGWDHIGIFSEADAYSAGLRDAIMTNCRARGITVLATETLDVNSDGTAELTRIRDSGARIIFLSLILWDDNLYNIIDRLGMNNRKYLFLGPHSWIAAPSKHVPVGSTGTILYTDSENEIWKNLSKFWADAYARDPNLTWKYPTIPMSAPALWDAMWLAFRAIKNVSDSGLPRTGTNIVNAIRTQHFYGASGPIQLLPNGDRITPYNLMNYDGVSWRHMGYINDGGIDFRRHDFVFGGNRTDVPPSQASVNALRIAASTATAVTFIVMGAIVVIAAATLLAFNVYNRDVLFIKMSSPHLNSVILLGTIVAAVYMIASAAAEFTADTRAFNSLCSLRLVCLVIGFTLSFGALFAKTYRVARIFGQKQMKVVRIHTATLFFYVGVLLVADVILLSVWSGVDPLHRVDVLLKSYAAPPPLSDDVIIQPYVMTCSSSNASVFSYIFYAYKGALILMGALLAFKTYHVNIPALNDSKQIGLAIYVCTVLAGVVVPVLSTLKPEQVDTSLSMSSGCVLACAVGLLTLIFAGKVVAIWNGDANLLTHTQGTKNTVLKSARSGLGRMQGPKASGTIEKRAPVI